MELILREVHVLLFVKFEKFWMLLGYLLWVSVFHVLEPEPFCSYQLTTIKCELLSKIYDLQSQKLLPNHRKVYLHAFFGIICKTIAVIFTFKTFNFCNVSGYANSYLLWDWLLLLLEYAESEIFVLWVAVSSILDL